jgi:hypothetical protein
MTIDSNKTTETDLRRGMRGLVNNLKENLPPRMIPQLPAAKDCHCERSEAIFSADRLDCFVVALRAMTGNRGFPCVRDGIPPRSLRSQR